MLKARHFTIFTDHKSITYAFQQKRDKCSPRQFNNLDFVFQFTTDIRHTSGQDNVVTDNLSRVESVTAPPSEDALAASQDSNDNFEHSWGQQPPCGSRNYHSPVCSHYLLRHVNREISAVRSGASTAPSDPVRPRSVATRHQSNSEADRTAIRVARPAEGLPHPGTCLPFLPALQSLPPHSHPTWRL
jgi:hypothetical protein